MVERFREVLRNKSAIRGLEWLGMAGEGMERLIRGMSGDASGGEGGANIEEWIVGKGHGGLLIC